MAIKKRTLDQKAKITLGEVIYFLERDGLGQSLSKEWIYDPSVEVPSVDLLAYVAAEMLYGPRRTVYFDAACLGGAKDVIAAFIRKTRELDHQTLKRTVENGYARLMLMRWGGVNVDQTPWHLCLWGAGLDHGWPTWNEGARRISALMMEIMSMRAIHERDWKQAEALAAALKSERTQKPMKRKTSDWLAFQIVLNYPHIARELRRTPSKEEIKASLLAIIPDGITDHPATWSEVWKMIRVPIAPEKSRRIDNSEIIRAARKLCACESKDSRKMPEWVRLARG